MQTQQLLKELSTLYQLKLTPTVLDILKATATRFVKATYVSGSGLAIVIMVMVLETVTLVGARCPVL